MSTIRKYKDYLNEEIDDDFGGVDEDIPDFDEMPKWKPKKRIKSTPVRRKKKTISKEIVDEMTKDNGEVSKKKIIRSEDGNIKLRMTTKLKKVFKILQTRKDTKKIADRLVDNIKKLSCDLSFFDIVEDQNDQLSYLPRNRIVGLERTKIEKDGKYKGRMLLKPYTNPQRQQMRLGRILNRLFPNEFNPREIELFVNEYKGEHDMSTGNIDIEVIEGKEVGRWYSAKKYAPGGTLNNSCMRYEPTTKFNLYSQNPEQIKMAIYTRGGKLEARAIVWYTNRGIFMDRVYYTKDHLDNAFKRYAERNGWMYKGQQPDPPKLTVIPHKGNFNDYPWLDTFHRQNNGTLTAY